MSDTMEIEYLEEIFNGPMRQKYDNRGRWAQIEEGRILYDLVQSTGADLFFEIGTANGWTACWAAAAGATVHTFDISKRAKIYQDKHFLFPEWTERIHFQEIGSPLCVEHMKKVKRGESAAVFLIDGDHTHAGVSRDFQAVIPLLRKGDVVVLHDVSKREIGVYRLWKSINRNYPGQCTGYSTFNGMGVLKW
jgi:predicted O-methyltransferase YrrM